MIDYRLQMEEPTEEDIIYLANLNTFRLFAGKTDLDTVMDDKDNPDPYLVIDPFKLLNRIDFDDVKLGIIDYFVELEEYKKCAFLRDYKYAEYVKIVNNF